MSLACAPAVPAPRPETASAAAVVPSNSRLLIIAFPPCWFLCVRPPALRRLELVGLLRQPIRKVARDLARFVLVEQMLHHQLGEVGTVDAARHVMPRRARAERARILVQA